MAESMTTDTGPRAHTMRPMTGASISGHGTSLPSGLARAHAVRRTVPHGQFPQTHHYISQRGFDGN